MCGAIIIGASHNCRLAPNEILINQLKFMAFILVTRPTGSVAISIEPKLPTAHYSLPTTV